MRRILIIVAVIVAITGTLFWLFRPETRAQRRHAEIPAEKTGTSSPTPIKERETIIALPIANEITPPNSPDATVDDDLGTLELVIAEFHKQNGGNPVGENVEITAALLGDNPKRLAYLPSKGSFLNTSGQLIDRWGTPYFFHQLSANQTEIMSAGPDRQFNTGDDVKR
jgi:hypothetical protein